MHALTTWYRDEVLGGLCSHESRSHMEGDLRRYLYCSAFAQLHDRSPKLNEFPAGLLRITRTFRRASTPTTSRIDSVSRSRTGQRAR